MSKGRNALAFAAGLGSGYLSARRNAEEDELREEDRAWRDEQRNFQREGMERERKYQQSLADAVAPRQAIEGTVVADAGGNRNLYQDPAQAAAAQADLQAEAEMRGTPTLADARPGFGVTGTSVGNRITDARPDVAEINTPQARNQRVIDATMAHNPAQGISLQNATTAAEKARFDMEEAQRRRRTEIEQEGLVATVRAAQSGDPAAVKAAFNKGGNLMVDGDLTVTTVKRQAPWGAEIDSYTYEGTVVDKDGKKRPVKVNSLDAMVSMLPFKDLFESQSQLGLADVKHKQRLAEIGAEGAERRKSQEHASSLDGGMGKPPSGYRWKNDGGLEPIPGGPGDKKQQGKPMPSSAVSGLLENHRNLRRAQTALQLISGNPVGDTTGDSNATGIKGYMPNQVLNRIDPAGVDTRAAIADLGSLVIHDRSGAAVTAAEFPRLAPFIPTEKDDPATARKKLAQFVKNYQAQIDDTTEFYREMGYNVPTQVLQPVGGGGTNSDGDLPRVATPADAAKLPSGTRFIDPNGVTRTVP